MLLAKSVVAGMLAEVPRDCYGIYCIFNVRIFIDQGEKKQERKVGEREREITVSKIFIS